MINSNNSNVTKTPGLQLGVFVIQSVAPNL